MKCKACTPLLYLYDELAESERLRADAHLAECAECRALLLRITDDHKRIASSFPTPGPNTAKILNAVTDAMREPPRRNIGEKLQWLLGAPQLKIGLASLSILLFGLFIAEQRTLPQTDVAGDSGTVPLDQRYLEKLHGTFDRARRTIARPSLLECIQSGQPQACAHHLNIETKKI